MDGKISCVFLTLKRYKVASAPRLARKYLTRVKHFDLKTLNQNHIFAKVVSGESNFDEQAPRLTRKY